MGAFTGYIRSGTRAGDELGNLTRSISSMLQNLGQYTRYLEKLPDTLAHEMNNPLNVVNSPLWTTWSITSRSDRRKYLIGAQRNISFTHKFSPVLLKRLT
ncbi:MAG: hypothetical protein CM1200mP41_11700 [Gammaproteobacteria bacterium]|nr:MAG: hypothetical protein CM1200mP41_11700 [Gammaproteobacteria bacterium]